MTAWSLCPAKLGLMLVTVVLAVPAGAATLYTSRAAWEAAVGSWSTETFDSPIQDSANITFANGIVSVGTGGSAGNSVVSGAYSADIDSSGEFEFLFDSISWKFPTPVIGFGLDLDEAANGTGLVISGNFDGTGLIPISILDILGSPGSGFFGLVGTAPFKELHLTEEFSVLNGIGAENFAADNLSVAVVPEPNTVALLLCGVAGLAARALRKPNQLFTPTHR